MITRDNNSKAIANLVQSLNLKPNEDLVGKVEVDIVMFKIVSLKSRWKMLIFL